MVFGLGAEGDSPEDEEGPRPGKIGRDHDRSKREAVEEDSTEESEDHRGKDLEDVRQGEIDVGVGYLDHEQRDREISDVVADLGKRLSPEQGTEPASQARIEPMTPPSRRIRGSCSEG